MNRCRHLSSKRRRLSFEHRFQVIRHVEVCLRQVYCLKVVTKKHPECPGKTVLNVKRCLPLDSQSALSTAEGLGPNTSSFNALH